MQGIVVRVGAVAVGGAGEEVILQENVVYVVKTETGELISQQSQQSQVLPSWRVGAIEREFLAP